MITKATIINYLLFLVVITIQAQNKDYIITTKGDTLTGKVTRGNLNSNHITLKNNKGKQKIHLQEIKEWRNGNMPVTVVSVATEKRTFWLELLLIVEGKKTLYRDLFHISGNNIYYTKNNNKYIQITKQYIKKYLRNELLQCKAFAEKYEQRKIKQSELEQLFTYHNLHCQTKQGE